MATDPLDRTITYRDLIAILDVLIKNPLGTLLMHDQAMKSAATVRMAAAGQSRPAFRCLSCGFILADQAAHSIKAPDGKLAACQAAGWVELQIQVTRS